MTDPHHSASTPLPWVARFAPLVPKGGRVLDVAAGGGRHSRLFLDRGHSVLAMDKTVSALDAIAHPAFQVVKADLEAEPRVWPPGETRFEGVVVTNYLWRPLMEDLLASVAPGGVLICETFAVGNERFGKPSRPDFLLKPGELLDTAQGTFDIIAYEHGLDRSGEAPAVKQRICARRPVGEANSEDEIPIVV